MAWAVLALCGGCAGQAHVTAPVTGGTVVIQFTVDAPRTAGLVLSGGQLGLEHLDLFGDVSASPQAMLHDTTLSPVSATAQTVSFTDLPQGIYSGLSFNVEHVQIDGSYRSTPLSVRFDLEGARVNLRATPPPELSDKDDVVKLPVTVDADVWWRDVDLTQAELDDGKILIDPYHNFALAETIARGVGSCFTAGTPIQ